MKEIKQNKKDVKIRIIAENNHYAGFGPATVSVSLICFEKKKKF